MTSPALVAHRGVTTHAPENTLAAFQQAIELGADAIELDVRLTADAIPVVFHYFYLDEITSLPGPIFKFTFAQLQAARFMSSAGAKISSLDEVMDVIGGKIELEIEIKGPELESVGAVARVLAAHRPLWDSLEVTSYEPALLLALHERCPGIALDLLAPRSENWMRLDVVAYLALHRARQAHARAVHLHPSQLSPEVISGLRHGGLDVHTWDVNDEQTLQQTLALQIPRLCTDRIEHIQNLLLGMQPKDG